VTGRDVLLWPMPQTSHSGFAASYVASSGAADPGDVMKCFAPGQLPVLTALAQEFAVATTGCIHARSPLAKPHVRSPGLFRRT